MKAMTPDPGAAASDPLLPFSPHRRPRSLLYPQPVVENIPLHFNSMQEENICCLHKFFFAEFLRSNPSVVGI
jgi:hypothetical protein